MDIFRLVILVSIHLLSHSSCEPSESDTKQLFEVERDSSGEENFTFLNGFVEQEPPDAGDYPSIVERGPPARDNLPLTTTQASTSVEVPTTAEITTSSALEEEAVLTTSFETTTARTTTSQTQDANTHGEEIIAVSGTTQAEEEAEGGGDMDIGCPKLPQSNLFHGFPGRDGLPGRDGNPGVHGIPGFPGSKGEPGSCDCKEEIKRLVQSNEFFVPNIHQCSWNKLSWSLEAGKVVTCTFNKKLAFTSLKVEWYGALRILCNRGSPCCNRWYITFNGAECANPMTIDGVIFTEDHNATINIHRSTAIAGICSGIPKGLVDVSLWTGRCDGMYPSGPSRTGWNSASRIIIQEIPM